MEFGTFLIYLLLCHRQYPCCILYCLGYSYSCNLLQQVRAYAVSVLERADDEELRCYLLQLVQALRFERSDKSRLALFLVQRCMFLLFSRFLRTTMIRIFFYLYMDSSILLVTISNLKHETKFIFGYFPFVHD